MVQIIIDKQNGELAFRLERFVDLSELISDQSSLERENLILDSIEKDVEGDIDGLQMKYENHLSIYEDKNSRILGAIDLAIADTIHLLEPYNKKVKNQELLEKETKEFQIQQKKRTLRTEKSIPHWKNAYSSVLVGPQSRKTSLASLIKHFLHRF